MNEQEHAPQQVVVVQHATAGSSADQTRLQVVAGMSSDSVVADAECGGNCSVGLARNYRQIKIVALDVSADGAGASHE
ncbi:hypothetical protein [Nocardioides sp. P5_C9_2]